MNKKIEKIIEQAAKLGIVNEIKVRNIKIREKFQQYRGRDKMKYVDAINKLGTEYFLGFYQIERILNATGNKNNKSTKAGNKKTVS